MIKLNFIGMSLIICFLAGDITACTSAPPTLTAIPLPSQTPTNIPTEPLLIATMGAFFALSVANVNASGRHFIFLINGQSVNEVDDDHFSRGLIGLAMEGYALGGKITYDFMDFILRKRKTR